MAAEIEPARPPGARALPRFNEAAANGRGNRPRAGPAAAGRRGFNEAAANGRGNQDVAAIARDAAAASMRPRRMAAEIPRAGLRLAVDSCCFNEAAANGRGNRGRFRRRGRGV